jgi:hypothetical protein
MYSMRFGGGGGLRSENEIKNIDPFTVDYKMIRTVRIIVFFYLVN